MRKILLIITLFISSIVYSQEYDDMYFNKNDRQSKKVYVDYTDNFPSNHISPEYIAKYTTKPKVTIYVQSYHKPYYYDYSRWNITFGFHYGWYNPYRYSYWNYYYGWTNPYHYWNDLYHYSPYTWWGRPYHRPYHNYYKYQHTHSYNKKTNVTTYKSEVKKQKRTSRGLNYNPNKSVRSYDRPSYSRTQSRTYNTPSRMSRTYSTPTRNRSTYTPSRSSGSSSRNTYTPSRSSGSSSRSSSRSNREQ